MPRLILLKPGETEQDRQAIMISRTDADLSDLGHLQAASAAHQIRQKWEPHFLSVSPLKRAIATAMRFEEQGPIPIHPTSRFQGMALGDWENESLSRIRHSDGVRFETWLCDPDFPAPGGESFREVYARVFPELVNIVQNANESEDETVVLVLQSMVLKVACCAILDLPVSAASRFKMDHGAHAVFERVRSGGPYQMLNWNCCNPIPNKSNSDEELAEELPEMDGA